MSAEERGDVVFCANAFSNLAHNAFELSLVDDEVMSVEVEEDKGGYGALESFG